MPLMILALAADPLLAAAADVEVLPHPCPVEVAMRFAGPEGKEEVQRLLLDPVSRTTTLLDGNGEPVTPAEPQDDAEAEETSEGGDSVSMEATRYGSLAAYRDLPFERISEEGGTVIIRTESLPDGTVEVGDKDISKNASMTLAIEENGGAPYVSRLQQKLEKPMRMRLVARLHTFEKDVRFGLVEGQPQPLEERIEAAFAVFGNDQTIRFSMGYDYPPCPAEAASSP